MAFLGDDDWDYQRRGRPPPRRALYTDYRRSAQQLNADEFLQPGASNLYRTRSQGNTPRPVINIYNDNVNSSSMRQESVSPPTVPPPYPVAPEAPFVSVRGRAGARLGDELNDLRDDVAELTMENRRLRSRSRGRSDVGMLNRGDFYEFELRQKEKELRELELRKQREREEDRIKTEMELARTRDEAKRKQEEEDREEERKRIINDHERKQREDAEAAKAEEQRIKEKLERDKREAEERERREWDDFLRRKREKDEAAAAAKKAEQEKIEAATRARLAEAGLSAQQIKNLLSEEKDKETTSYSPPLPPSLAVAPPGWSQRRPTYAKVLRAHLAIETLVYFGIPYEYDRNDPNYLIILREMDRFETEALFEHTKRLRDRGAAGGGGKLLLEAPARDRPKYAWYRKREKSVGKGPDKIRRLGVLEY